MEETIEAKKRVFGFKLDASKFHLAKMQFFFKDYINKFEELAKIPDLPMEKEIRPFFYHYDAFLFELFSCFDIILHIVRVKYSLPIKEDRSKWDRRFKMELRNKNNDTYELIEKIYREWWMEDLRTARHYITHRERPVLGVELKDSGIALLFFALPEMHQQREMFEQCDIWIRSIINLFNRVIHA